MPTNPYGPHDAPIVTVDVVIFTLDDGNLKTLVQPRRRDPHKGIIGLVGGWVHANEDKDLDAVVERVLRTKAGLEDVYVEQVRSDGSATRHPEGWSISVVYMAILPMEQLRPAFDHGCQLVPADHPGELAFDHNKLLGFAVERLRSKGAYSTIPMEFLPDEFSMRDLLGTYEAVLDMRLDEGSFRRKILELKLIESTGRKEKPREGLASKRTSVMYRRTTARTFDRSFRR
ncbi:NUDIX hydrolase [Agrobacterium rubi]|nr:NUDIX hydrolase [Agrobacterium rubi]NTF24650.1 NUDIX hydrolase [Agrobacterium rubi]